MVKAFHLHNLGKGLLNQALTYPLIFQSLLDGLYLYLTKHVKLG